MHQGWAESIFKIRDMRYDIIFKIRDIDNHEFLVYENELREKFSKFQKKLGNIFSLCWKNNNCFGCWMQFQFRYASRRRAKFCLKNGPFRVEFHIFWISKNLEKKEKISYFSENTRYEKWDFENHEISRIQERDTRPIPGMLCSMHEVGIFCGEIEWSLRNVNL